MAILRISSPRRIGQSSAAQVTRRSADGDSCASWTVIASYFADKTLVSQQIDSFNEFVNNTMQELVDENGTSLPLPPSKQRLMRSILRQLP